MDLCECDRLQTDFVRRSLPAVPTLAELAFLARVSIARENRRTVETSRYYSPLAIVAARGVKIAAIGSHSIRSARSVAVAVGLALVRLHRGR
jgi:hypothetical protein